MKTNIVGVIIALILAFVGVAGAWGEDKKISEVRKVHAFSSIKVTSVATIYFIQSNTYSLKIAGGEKEVKTTTATVKNDCLIVGFKEGGKQRRSHDEGVTIYLSAPNLKKMEFTGVGSFNCNESLKLNHVKFQIKGVGKVNVKTLTCKSLKVDLQGVGEVDIHVACEYLSASIDGLGNVTLSGTARKADISKNSIGGGVNIRNLKIGCTKIR